MVTPAGTKESGPKVKSSSSSAGGLLQSVLTQRGRLASQKADVLPSALPQNLLPLLGRGLSVSSLPGSRSLEHQSRGLLRRVKPPPSAAASGTGSDPTEPLPTSTHSQPPHTHTHAPEQEEEITTVDTILGTDTETGTPPPGMSPRAPSVGRMNIITVPVSFLRLFEFFQFLIAVDVH